MRSQARSGFGGTRDKPATTLVLIRACYNSEISSRESLPRGQLVSCALVAVGRPCVTGNLIHTGCYANCSRSLTARSGLTWQIRGTSSCPSPGPLVACCPFPADTSGACHFLRVAESRVLLERVARDLDGIRTEVSWSTGA